MSPTIISAVHGTGNVQSERLVVDMSKSIAYLEPESSPLTVVLKRIRSEGAHNPKFNCLEAPDQPRWDAVNNPGGYAAAAAAIVVDNGTYFAAQDLIKVPRTGEVMLVTVVAANTLTVTRSYGTTAAAALNNDEPLLIIGNAHEEGAALGAIRTIQLEVFYNYTQIFRKPFGVTGTEAASLQYGGTDLSVTRRLQGIEHMKDIERALLFGERALYTPTTAPATTTHPLRLTGGVLSFVSTNIKDAGLDVTENEVEDWLEDLFRYGSSSRLLFCSARWISIINGFARGKLQTVPKDQTYGINLKEYLSGHGTLYIHKHKLLEGTIYGGYAIGIDVEDLAYRYLNANGENRDTKLRVDVGLKGTDAQQDEYLSECGLYLVNEKKHGYIYGPQGRIWGS